MRTSGCECVEFLPAGRSRKRTGRGTEGRWSRHSAEVWRGGKKNPNRNVVSEGLWQVRVKRFKESKNATIHTFHAEISSYKPREWAAKSWPAKRREVEKNFLKKMNQLAGSSSPRKPPTPIIAATNPREDVAPGGFMKPVICRSRSEICVFVARCLAGNYDKAIKICLAERSSPTL